MATGEPHFLVVSTESAVVPGPSSHDARSEPRRALYERDLPRLDVTTIATPRLLLSLCPPRARGARPNDRVEKIAGAVNPDRGHDSTSHGRARKTPPLLLVRRRRLVWRRAPGFLRVRLTRSAAAYSTAGCPSSRRRGTEPVLFIDGVLRLLADHAASCFSGVGSSRAARNRRARTRRAAPVRVLRNAVAVVGRACPQTIGDALADDAVERVLLPTGTPTIATTVRGHVLSALSASAALPSRRVSWGSSTRDDPRGFPSPRSHSAVPIDLVRGARHVIRRAPDAARFTTRECRGSSFLPRRRHRVRSAQARSAAFLALDRHRTPVLTTLVSCAIEGDAAPPVAEAQVAAIDFYTTPPLFFSGLSHSSRDST